MAGMAPGRAAAYIGGTTLLAAWLASASGIQRAPAAPAAGPRREAVQIDALASGVQAQAARLRARMAAAPAERASARNPFAFGAPAEARPRRGAPAAGTRPTPVVADVPDVPLALIGIAERGHDAARTRTAMLAAPGDQLFMVTEGEELAGRYRVGAIGADAVELKDLTTGAIRRLGLR